MNIHLRWLKVFALFALLFGFGPSLAQAQTATMSSPTPNSTLTGSTVTFSWSNVSASQYQLDVGTSVGSTNIFSAAVYGSTSQVVTGIPTNGSTIYVRLWTFQISTGWSNNSYQYTAAGSSGSPAFSISKTHSGNFTQGQTNATYTITVTNSGTAPTTGTVTVTDTVPTGLTLVSMAGTGWSCSGNSCNRSNALAAGASYPSITLTVNVSASAPSSVTNSATVSGGGAANATANDPTTVNSSGSPSLSISKTHSGNFTQGQANATYTITVANNGTAASSGTVTVTDSVPTGLTLVSMAGTGWSCSGNSCNRSNALAAGSSYPAITLTVNVSGSAPSNVTNSATVSGGGAANATANDPTTIGASGSPSLSISKTHSGNFTQGQSNATYTITVTNSGTAATAGTVTVTDTVPTGLTLVSMAGTGWSCSANSCNRSNALAAGLGYPPITLTVNVSGSAPSSVTNSATVSGGGSGNATANDPTTVIPSGSPSLSISKTHSGNFTLGQANATYTITVTNNGTAATTGTVTVTDTVPTGLTLVSMAGTGWSCSANSCNRSNALAAGASYPSITLTVNVSGSAASSVTNSATVSGGGSGSSTANDPTTINPPGAPAPSREYIRLGSRVLAIENANAAQAPAQVTLVSPSNNATGQSGTPTLSWNASSSATSYDIYLGTSSSPPLVGNVTSTNYPVSGLSPTTLYYWKIVAKNSAGSAPASATWSFTTMQVPPQVTLISPSNGATGQSTAPTLSWNASSGATSYDVYLGTSSSPPLIGSVTSTSYPASGLSGTTLYYWKIVAKNSAGSAPASATRSFTTQSSAPSVTSVTPGSGIGNTVQFVSTYSNPGGYGAITGTELLLNSNFSASNACWISWDANGFRLANNAGTGSQSIAPQSPSSISNSQCTLHGSGSYVSGAGNTLTVYTNVTFNGNFGGTKNKWAYVANNLGLNSSWQQMGTWTIPQVSVSISPTTVTLTGGQGQQFTATVTNTANTTVTWSRSPAVGALNSSGYYTAPNPVTSGQWVYVTATSVADPTKSATASVYLSPPPPPISLSSVSPTYGTSRRDIFNYSVNVASGAYNIDWLQPFFAATYGGSQPGDTGAQGCHVLAYPLYNVIYLDGDYGGFNWIGTTYTGGTDVQNSYCIVHGGTSSQTYPGAGTSYTLALDIEFRSPTWGQNRYQYLSAQDTFWNLADWQYFGWWTIP